MNAIDVARKALLEIAEVAQVGEHLQSVEADGLQIIQFENTHQGYVGWRWCASVNLEYLTVNEVWLEPGDGALVAKAWVPWSSRLQPGDLVPGDVIETADDDTRLVPGYTDVENMELQIEPLTPLWWSLGLGRVRVLSNEGVDEAVARWRQGDNGPRSPFARYAELNCVNCGWLIPVGGKLGQAFGICANSLSPSDGKVVSFDHGCGAHSESVLKSNVAVSGSLVIDEVTVDQIDPSELIEDDVHVDLHESDPVDPE
ncbi:MAG: hypothetical protein RIS09_142 [Actinomycetota bacterium]